ncbi:MAG: serine protease, partial [Deltaproteobacteria bacterium]|nr:serine protease [Deltaproteobacteria bacterium]
MAFDSVIRIFATTQDPDYDCPWQACAPEQSTGSGVVVGKNTILTGAHVVANATYLQVRRQSDPVKVEARVRAICHDADLALLEVTDPHFISSLQPANIGLLPDLASKVSVVGFPVGGEELSVTEGVVSRVEVQTFQHSGRRLLAVTVDAAINEGNSGGPVFQDDKVVGIAFQKLSGDTDNIGEMVPPMLLRRFLDDSGADDSGADDKHQHDTHKKDAADALGADALHAPPIIHRVHIPGLGIRVQKIENTCLRTSLGLRDDEGGLLVLGVEHEGSAEHVLKEGDVVLKLGDHDVAGNGTIAFAGRHRTQAVALLGDLRIGDSLDVRVLRAGKRIDLELKLKPYQ